MTGLVDTQSHGRVLVISMRREHKRNAFDRQLADELDRALNALDDDPDVWAGVLTGTTTVFSAGSDLTSNGDYITERGGEYGIIRRQRSKPLVAAIEGFALGGGFEVALACDLIVAAADATIGLPEVRRGLVAVCGGLFRGPRALPLNLAREMILTGQPVDVARLHAAGVVNIVAPPGQALARALTLAEQICTNAPPAVQASLRAVQTVVDTGDPAGWEATALARSEIASSLDLAEGVAAFLEKRPPRWSGV